MKMYLEQIEVCSYRFTGSYFSKNTVTKHLTFHKKNMKSFINSSLLLKIFLAVAYLIKTKGLSCLKFLKFQPLEKIVAYKRCL